MSERTTYIRFVTSETHPPFGHRTGVFDALYEVVDNENTAGDSVELGQTYIDWFRRNLPTPYRFSRSKNPHAQEVALSWFKPTATEQIVKFREVVAFVEQHGHHVVALKTKRPGYIVYEDEFQIVATPFSDTPT